MGDVKTIDDFLGRNVLEDNLDVVDLDNVVAPIRLNDIVQGRYRNLETDSGLISNYLKEDPRHYSISNDSIPKTAVKINYFYPDEEIVDQAQEYVDDIYSRLFNEEDNRIFDPLLDGGRLFSNAVEAARRKRNSEGPETAFSAFVVELPLNYDENYNLNQALGPSEIEQAVPRPDQLKIDDRFSVETDQSEIDKVSVLTDDITIYARNIQDLIRGIDKSNQIPNIFHNIIDEQVDAYLGTY